MIIGDVAWEFWPNIVGGLGTYQWEVYKRIAKTNEVHAIAIFREGDEKEKEIVDGINVYRIKIKPELFKVYKLFMQYNWFIEGGYFDFNLQSIEILNSIKNLDIIHTHDWLSMWSGYVATQHLKKPWIVNIHSLELGRNPFPNNWIVEIEKLGMNANKVIAVSNDIKNQLINIGYPQEKIEVIYNGIDSEKYDPSKIDRQKAREKFGFCDEKIILFIGRPVREKGINVLIDAFKEAKKEIKNLKLVLLSRGYIENLIKGVDGVLQINRFVTEQERLEIIALSDVFVVPSLYEPFGIVTLEGMAMKKPVIGSRTGGIKEVIEDGKSGLLFEPGNVKELAEKIKFVLKNEDEAEKLKEGGRKRAEKFSWDETVRKTLDVYKKFI